MEEFKNPQTELENGLGKRINSLHTNAVVDDISQTVKDLVVGREDYPYDQQRLISKYGNDIVTHIRVGRTPLPSTITKLLNLVTFGGFQKMIDKSPYDDLFHLFCIISLDSGVDILVEKNQAINMKRVSGYRSYNPKGSEYIDINVRNGLSFTELLNNTRKIMGRDFFNYHPTNNNCQDFIVSLLSGSGILSNDAKDFIKQNVTSIFTKYPRTRKLMATLTKIGTAADVVSKGFKLKFI